MYLSTVRVCVAIVEDPHSHPHSQDGFISEIHRTATLEYNEIDDYKNSIKKTPKMWLVFSSASKKRDVATIYDRNTLFIITIPSQSQHLDISSISKFSAKEEVLLGPSTSFQVENV
ncbi:unnamed protein product [Adineta steineri]|uniref:ADP ribosyltransferase domain-containing protein n=1 Tax=Adineta steineri TaxID=433720 RepID=A0A814ZCP2_9BILA|nr:unnamed protein product [Adineta steineri]CAF1530057.1 unnamed protein product [Adineta steineri]